MDILNKIQDFIKNLDDKDFFKYLAIFLASILIIFSGSFYLHYRRVNFYLEELENIKKDRKTSADILTKNKIVLQQRAKVDQIINQDKGTFRLSETILNIIKKLKLDDKLENKELSEMQGSFISDKVEQFLAFKLNNITTKNLVDLLLNIAEIERLYPKELTILKNKDNQTINIELNIATLEQKKE